MNIWWVMVIGGLLTFGIRLSFIAIEGKFEPPKLVRRALRFIPPAVLSAIILPELVLHTGKMDISAGNLRLMAGLIAMVIAWRTKNALITIIAGMCLLLVFKYISII
jgi:branched-subunit amino acid transport protein